VKKIVPLIDLYNEKFDFFTNEEKSGKKLLTLYFIAQNLFLSKKLKFKLG
jgi:hypothetical protein